MAMLCSPTRLFLDISFWSYGIDLGKNGEDSLNISGGGHSPGHSPDDCAFLTLPCESEIVKTVDENLVFWFDLIVMYILSTCIVVVGIVTNIFNIVIFSKNHIITRSANSLLLGLAVSDLFTLLVYGVMNFGGFLCFWDVAVALSYFNIVFVNGYAICRYFNLLSLDFVVVISMQRAAAVLSPFKVTTMFSNKHINVIIGVLVSLCFIQMIPTRIALRPVWYFHHYFNQTISLRHDLKMDFQLYVDYTLYFIGIRGVAGLVLIFIPMTLIIIKLNRQAGNRAAMTANTTRRSETSANSIMSVREVKVVKMSLIVCFVTCVTYTCVFVTTRVTQVHSELLFKSSVNAIVLFTELILISTNSSYNFFLYLAMSDKYRENFKKNVLLFRLKN